MALVPADQVSRPLTGLNGLAATEGREAGAELAGVLARDAAAEQWVRRLGLEPGPGAGAASGAGLLLQALGGSVVDPLSLLAERYRLADTLQRADLVVTGAEELDFHAVGGAVVKRVAAMAGEALRPVIAVVGRNFISSRELRLAGLEQAYPLLAAVAPGETTPDLLADVSRQVATTWSW